VVVIKWKKERHTYRQRYWIGYPIVEGRPPWRSSVSEEQIPTDAVLWRVAHLLREKNEKYGDSALNPIRMFYKGGEDAVDMIRIRLDDKLSRLARGSEGIESDLDIYHDLIGYLALLIVAIESKGEE
jgi:hypothetical protein